jgi:hypothetical protein
MILERDREREREGFGGKMEGLGRSLKVVE